MMWLSTVRRVASESSPQTSSTMSMRDTISDTDLWEEPSADLRNKVVAAIASEYGIIARRLAAESRRKPPAELDTYEAMLRYYTHQITPSPESAQACLVALQRAAELEPEYGPVWSALATLYCQMFSFDAPGFGDALGTALEHARKGVFLEPGSQLARMILAYASYLAEDSESFREESEIDLPANEVMTIAQAARLLGVYTQAVSLALDRGDLTLLIDRHAPKRQGRRLVLRREIDAWQA